LLLLVFPFTLRLLWVICGNTATAVIGDLTHVFLRVCVRKMLAVPAIAAPTVLQCCWHTTCESSWPGGSWLGEPACVGALI
jgi:hypothetical protein